MLHGRCWGSLPVTFGLYECERLINQPKASSDTDRLQCCLCSWGLVFINIMSASIIENKHHRPYVLVIFLVHMKVEKKATPRSLFILT